MKLAIERTLFGFNDGIDTINVLNDKFTPLSILLNRLLSEKYTGKKIKYLNLFFYETSEKLQKAYGKDYFLHYYGGQFTYKKVINYNYFLGLSFNGQKHFIWKEAYNMLQFAGDELKNYNLKESSEYAFNTGLQLNLNADFRMLETDITLFEEKYKASLWLNFTEENMEANFTLEKDNEILLNKLVHSGSNGMEFFLVMFKKIESKGNSIFIRATKDLSYLPLQINFAKKAGKVEFS
ncbi:hypothetical protein ACFFLS_11795 [Flavobacterium procerum]|uniref:Uncharacterized protein n=1 Tax=Flavobacterium procerum TaxID=1455569 RepID=A0ABV6BSY5_9FLAO